MACVNMIAADTDKEANKLATSLYQMFIGIVTGRRKLLQPPVDNMDKLWTDYEKELTSQMLNYSFIGNPETIKEQMQQFINETKINEIMVISNIYDHKAKIHSYELFVSDNKERFMI